MDKAEKYGWAEPGDEGFEQKIQLGLLKLDHTYQRKEVSEDNTLRIAQNFNWLGCATLTVMRRETGELYVVDGQQRLCAMRLRGDITHAPCKVFKSRGRDAEAFAFLMLNTHRKPVQACDKFVAGARANILPYSEIADWLRPNKLYVKAGNVPNGIAFPTTVIQTYNWDSPAAKRALLLQRQILGGVSPLNVLVHKGLFYLAHNLTPHGIQIENFEEKIMKAGGQTAMLHEIRVWGLELAKTASIRICGQGIARLLDKGVRPKNRILPLLTQTAADERDKLSDFSEAA